MAEVLWLSGEDVRQTGVCRIEETVKIVEQAFCLFDAGQACIVEESALRLGNSGLDQACYCLPAYVGGDFNTRGLKWSVHGHALEPGTRSRIQATVVVNGGDSGVPLAVMNGTEIGAARTGAVTASALSRLAPQDARKVAICGAGGQAEHQLQAVLWALPQVQEISVWSRGNVRNHELVRRYQEQGGGRLRAVPTLEEAVEGADVVIAATSAPEPYLQAEHLRDTALYCHIGFNEITKAAVDCFDAIIVDTWEEAKAVSGQSLFRLWRQGVLDISRIRGTLGGVISGRQEISCGSREKKVMFDAFGLPIFDLSVAKEAYLRAKEQRLGVALSW